MKAKNLKKATFGAGCFWHVEDKFSKISGVVETRVGFMGGKVSNPSYKMVCGGDTGCIEATEMLYDPDKISYNKLVEAFFEMHDPTQSQRQGQDIGEQYSSVIFYHSEEQKKEAEKVKEKLEKSGKFTSEIVTRIQPAEKFYKAEEYHQKYLEKNK
jgi:peptide-methionine (S)-S-oxide reductase